MYLETEHLVTAVIAERQREADRWRRASAAGRESGVPLADRRPRRRLRLHPPVVDYRPV